MHPDENWPAYFARQRGRPVRPELLRALDRLPAGVRGTAIDLGAGDGTETRHLLQLGWQVLAVDATPGLRERVAGGAPGDLEQGLTTQQTTFARLGSLPGADLVWAGMSLPFCHRDELDHVLGLVAGALAPEGRLVGHLLGDRDDWRTRPGVTTLTRDELATVLQGFTVLDDEESEHDGPSGTGPKHWHTHLVTAGRRATS